VNQQLASAATSRLELLIRRLFALTLFLASIETVVNAWGEREYLNNFGIATIGIFVVIVLGVNLHTWFGRNSTPWIWAFAVFSIIGSLLWPFQVTNYQAMPAEFQPWFWWVIGMGVVAAGVAAKPIVSLTHLVATVVIWFALDTSEFAGSTDWSDALQDSTYIFLFGGTILGLFFLVREAVGNVDAANTRAIRAAVEQARVDAVERERQRIDALVHDRVLSTLLLSANASNAEEQRSAMRLAKEAIQSLEAAKTEPRESTISALGLFRALRRAALQLSPGADVSIAAGGSNEVPGVVAQALTEAIIQALDNAVRHAKATKISLEMVGTSDGIRIRLSDDGIGFRLDRIPRDRIGVRTSILARAEAVGASVKITTAPGSGTQVEVEWAA
jgi:signal transduction histidine kinase